MRTPELSMSGPEEFWSSIDEDVLDTFTEYGGFSSDTTHTPEHVSYIPTIQPEEIAKRLLHYVTGDRS